MIEQVQETVPALWSKKELGMSSLSLSSVYWPYRGMILDIYSGLFAILGIPLHYIALAQWLPPSLYSPSFPYKLTFQVNFNPRYRIEVWEFLGHCAHNGLYPLKGPNILLCPLICLLHWVQSLPLSIQIQSLLALVLCNSFLVIVSHLLTLLL